MRLVRPGSRAAQKPSATPHPINHHYHRGGGDINNIFIAAATIRGEPRPAPCPHFPTFPAPLHTSSAVAHRTRCVMSHVGESLADP